DDDPIGILEFIEQEKVVSPEKKSETKTKSAKKFIKEKKTEKNETKPKSKYIKNKEEIDTDKLKKGKGKLPEQVEKDNEKQNINESAKKT
nr:hypothetical protein [Candidatus Cloacimonadota bacterium]